MSKIAITGGAVVVTSSILATSVETLERANPNALVLHDKNENPVFAISYRKGKENGGVANAGIIFNGIDSAGFLRLTLPINDGDEATKKSAVENQLLNPMLKLAMLTEQIDAAVADVVGKTAKIFGNMTIS